MTCALGDPASEENVYLKLGGIFDQQIELREADGDPWSPPVGTTLEFVFGPDPLSPMATWPATINGNIARVQRTVAQVSAVRNILRDGTPVRIRMVVPPDTEPDVKTVGMVVWQ
ncbi:hypothetical protein SEA_HANS_39 [Gordonia phage Hans]|nr:hypothetical protein SEA_HANS_39 [Gordonia phage Hans]